MYGNQRNKCQGRGRPRRGRHIQSTARSNYYKPAGIPAATLESITLTIAEIEALHLADLEGEGQATAAEKMGISQPTFHRELKAARQKVADALLNGKAIILTKKENTGGEKMPNNDGTGPEGKGPRTGRGLGNCAPKAGAVDEEATPRLGIRRGGAGRGMGRCRR